MKKVLSLISTHLLFAFISLAFASESLVVHNAWIRSAPPNAKVLAAYMMIMNHSDESIALTKVSGKLFRKVEIHRTEMHDGMMKMTPQNHLNIPARGSVTLDPGGYHLMLKDPATVPKKGDTVELELLFNNGKILHIKASVSTGEDKGGMMEKGHHH